MRHPAVFGRPPPGLATPGVGDQSYFDLGFGYEFNDYSQARVNINNLFDSNPLQMVDAVIQNNTDTGLYDIFGRSHYLSLSAKF